MSDSIVIFGASGDLTSRKLIPALFRLHLKGRLPWYALPASVLVTRQFPRTSTGKIDRRALREQAILQTLPGAAAP